MGANTQDITNYQDTTFHNQEIIPPMLVDEVSTTEYYVGHSKNTDKKGEGNWRIKRIWQVSGVWNFGFPEGNQDFVWNWDLRDTYTYSA